MTYLVDRIEEIPKDRKERFKVFCSKVMKEYERNGKWSRHELIVKGILEKLGFIEKIHYYHNYKLQNPFQTGYYSLDFFIPRLKLVIEVDGRIWHKAYYPLGDTKIMYTKTCPYCSREFQTPFKKQKYCSRKCYQESRRIEEELRRQIWEKYYEEEKSIVQIAKELNLNHKTVRKYLGRIYKKRPKWTKKKVKEEFLLLTEKLNRIPTTSELAKMNEGLRHAIYRRYGSYNKFLFEIWDDIPLENKNHLKIPSLSPAYYSELELEMKKILEWLGFRENKDFFHNYRIGRWFLDFYFPKLKLVIEVDSVWHDSKEKRKKDQEKDEDLSNLGILVIRVREKEISKVKEIIKERNEELGYSLSNSEEKDRIRDKWLNELGLLVVRYDTEEVEDLEYIEHSIRQFIQVLDLERNIKWIERETKFREIEEGMSDEMS